MYLSQGPHPEQALLDGGEMGVSVNPVKIESLEAFEYDFFTEICSGSEAGSYLRCIDFVYHSTLGLRVTKKKERS